MRVRWSDWGLGSCAVLEMRENEPRYFVRIAFIYAGLRAFYKTKNALLQSALTYGIICGVETSSLLPISAGATFVFSANYIKPIRAERGNTMYKTKDKKNAELRTVWSETREWLISQNRQHKTCWIVSSTIPKDKTTLDCIFKKCAELVLRRYAVGSADYDRKRAEYVEHYKVVLALLNGKPIKAVKPIKTADKQDLHLQALIAQLGRAQKEVDNAKSAKSREDMLKASARLAKCSANIALYLGNK